MHVTLADRNYLGTLKIARRLFPRLIVCISEPTNTRFLPLVATRLQPLPFVIFAPLGAFVPLIVISTAMIDPFVVSCCGA